MNLKTMIVALAALFALYPVAACAAELRVLSAGAIEPGLRPVLAAFEKASGHTVQLTFATAPQIRERVSAGAAFDIVIAPPGVLGDAEVAKKIDADPAARASIGRVGIGVAVRPGAPRPDIASAESFKRAMVEADSLVFNRASTGIYIEALLARLGVEGGSRVTRYPDGASVMTHVVKGQGREIGLRAITEILLAHDQGLLFVGPLPPALQNFTTYRAAAAAAPADRDIARALLKHLASHGAQTSFVAAGIEAAD